MRSLSRPVGLLLATLVLCGVCTAVTASTVFWTAAFVSQHRAGRTDRDVPGESGAGDAAGPDAQGYPSEGADGSGAGVPGEPVEGGILRLPGGDPTTLDPALVRDLVSAEYMYEIYSGLVTLSPQLEVIPDLAERWDVSPDGRVYTFTLRSGVVFHNGVPVTSSDVAWSIERACDPATKSLVGASYLGDIVGCKEKLAGKAGPMDGLTLVDPHKIAITIDAPKAYFLAKLTYPTAFVLDRQQVSKGEGWTDRPNGTGPFKLAEYDKEELLVLERNDRYYRDVAYLDRVEYDLRPVDAMTRYENEELDATPVSALDRERVRDPLNPLSYEVLDGAGSLDITYVAFDVTKPPFDDVHVRRAINFAVDKARLAKIVLKDAVLPAESILPPGLPGHSDGVNPYRFDVAEAKAELAKSRYGGPAGVPPITLNVSSADPAVADVADTISSTLGISVSVEVAEWDQFQKDVEADAYACFVLGWSADYADPQDFLDVLFHSQSPLNHIHYANPEVDKRLEAARVLTDEAARFQAYHEAERMILEDAPWVPLYHGTETWLVAPYVHGFTVPPIVVPRMAAVWLEAE